MVAINWFDKKAKEEKELELQRGKDYAENVFEQRETPPPTTGNDLAERLVNQSNGMNSASNQKSIAELLAEKRGDQRTIDQREKDETAAKIAHTIDKLKNKELLTQVEGRNDGANNISDEEAAKLAEKRSSKFANMDTYAQVNVSAAQRQSNAGKATSDKEAKQIATGRVAAFTNADMLKQVKVSEKQRTSTIHSGDADISAFEMVGRMASGLNKDINKASGDYVPEDESENKGEGNNGSV